MNFSEGRLRLHSYSSYYHPRSAKIYCIEFDTSYIDRLGLMKFVLFEALARRAWDGIDDAGTRSTGCKTAANLPERAQAPALGCRSALLKGGEEVEIRDSRRKIMIMATKAMTAWREASSGLPKADFFLSFHMSKPRSSTSSLNNHRLIISDTCFHGRDRDLNSQRFLSNLRRDESRHTIIILLGSQIFFVLRVAAEVRIEQRRSGAIRPGGIWQCTPLRTTCTCQ